TLRGIRAAARPRANAADVVARLSRAPALALLEGHSEAAAAAGRLAVGELIERIVTSPPGSAAPAARDRSPEDSTASSTSGPPLWLPDAARALRALDPRHEVASGPMPPSSPARTRASLDEALDTVRAVLLQD